MAAGRDRRGAGGADPIPAAFTYILVNTAPRPFRELPRRVGNGDFQETIWSMGLGRVGFLVYAASVAVVVVLIVRALRADERTDEQMFASAVPTR